MDLATIIVVVGLTALSFGAIVWLNIYSRRTQLEMSDDEGQSSSTYDEQSDVR
jgi:hypothetical protein